MAIRTADFDYVRELVKQHAAIVLETGKEYLVENRLAPVAKEHGCESLEIFIDKLRTRQLPDKSQDRVIQALTTNETYFFRDLHPFEALKLEILPKLIGLRASQKSLRIWSAASSTGQEAYSICMTLKEHFPSTLNWRIDILGADLSDAVLAKAKEGKYTQLEVNRGLPAPLLFKYFEKRDDHFFVKEELRRMVRFMPMNLIKPWMPLPLMDIVFIRNVLIYFDIETKKKSSPTSATSSPPAATSSSARQKPLLTSTPTTSTCRSIKPSSISLKPEPNP